MSKDAPRDGLPSAGSLQGSFDRRLLMSLLAGAAGAPGLAFAQSQPVQVPSGAPTHPATQPPPTPETGTLIGKRDRSARMTTKVLINGQGPYDFVIDTGANRSVIATELAAQLQLPAGNPTRVHGIARVQDAQTVNVKSLRAGAVEAPIEDVPLLARVDLDADGILGIDAFADRQVTFDFVANVVRINRATFEHGFTERPTHSIVAASSDITVPARQRFGQLTIVDADAAHEKITCFVDSGAEKTVGNLAMRRAVQAVTADRNFIPTDVLIYGATGQEVPGQVALVPSMRIGGVHFTSFPVAFADLHTFDLWGLKDQPALMLGMDLLRIFESVTVDFGHKSVRFRLASLMSIPGMS
jgi:predicted aspartyl protease